jgi:hypothetical protein
MIGFNLLKEMNKFEVEALDYIKGIRDLNVFDTSINVFLFRLSKISKDDSRVDTAYDIIEKYHTNWTPKIGWTLVYDETDEDALELITSHNFEINVILSSYFLSPQVKAYIESYKEKLNSIPSIDKLVNETQIMKLILSLHLDEETETLISNAMLDVVELDNELNYYQAFHVIIGILINKITGDSK